MKIVTTLEERFEYDEKIRQEFGVFAGTDEAGRGPLAGPVTAAAVILPSGVIIDGVNDSKKLSAKKREAVAQKIKENALAWCIGEASVSEIEEMNILNAAMLAMKRAVDGLKIKPQYVLADGNKIPPIDTIKTDSLVGGDALCASIGAASILAKTKRDDYMKEAALKYPEYGFESNMGYGTLKHREALLKYGPCEIHRPSFLKKILAK